MIIHGGYYLKARKIQDSEIAFAPPHVREIWDWLIKEVNHKDVKEIKRGTTVSSLRDIQEGLKWYVGYRKEMYSKSKCEMAMKWLRKRGMIKTTKTTRGMIITVCNYDIYQEPKNYETNNEIRTKPTRNKQQFPTINKNDKNVKNDKNKEYKQKFNFKNELLNLGVDSKIVSDWLEVRRKKKAANTETAFNRLKIEIEKSELSANECIKIAAERSWQGFNHKWLENGKNWTNNGKGFKSDTTRRTIESFEERVNKKR